MVAQLNLGQIAEFSLNCHLKVKTLFPQNLCSLVPCSMYFLHLIFKFAFLSWQVPRSSVGRALYRECGPSQDGDPDPGNLPFSVFVFVVFCRVFTFFFYFGSLYNVFYLLSLIRLLLSHAPEFENYQIKQQSFCSNVILESKHFSLSISARFFLAAHSPLVTYNLQICSSFMQVPLSSVGRALYRESGPSQDGDPDTGNLLFSLFFF